MMEGAQKNPAAANLVYIPGYPAARRRRAGQGRATKSSAPSASAARRAATSTSSARCGARQGQGPAADEARCAALPRRGWRLLRAVRGAPALQRAGGADAPPRSQAYAGPARGRAGAATPPRSKALLAAGADLECARRARPHAAARGDLRAPARGDPRAGARPAPNLDALENDRYDAVTIAAVADDEATLRAAAVARRQRRSRSPAATTAPR